MRPSVVVDDVTPAEIAKSLKVNPKALRAWLRAERAARHPMLDAHEHGTHYHFTHAEAIELIAEYRGFRRSGPAPDNRSGVKPGC